MSDETYARKSFLGHVPTESVAHRFHPATRLAAFLCFSCLPLFISVPEVNILIIVAHLGMLRIANVKASVFFNFVPVLIAMAVFMTVIAVATASSSAPNQTAISCATALQTQLIITLNSYVRITAMFSATLFYFATNAERDFLSALRFIGLPFTATYILGLSLRSAALFADDLRSIREAERGRGADRQRVNLAKHVTKGFMYVVPLFAIGIRRIEEISDALFCRGFSLLDTSAPRIRYPGYIAARYQFKLRDTLMLGSLVGVLFLTAKLSIFDHAFELRDSPIANGWLCQTKFQ